MFIASAFNAVAQQESADAAPLTAPVESAAPVQAGTTPPTASSPAAGSNAARANADANVPTLGQVQALAPEDTEEALDLHAFRNPVTVDPNTFSKSYDTGISPEQMALDDRYGGYVVYGINQGLLHTWKGIKKLTHMRPYEQPATARPPPLTEAQMRRAVQESGAGE